MHIAVGSVVDRLLADRSSNLRKKVYDVLILLAFRKGFDDLGSLIERVWCVAHSARMPDSPKVSNKEDVDKMFAGSEQVLTLGECLFI